MVFHKRTVKDVPIDHKTVLVRADYNVPLLSDGKISDDLRIRASLPTIKYLLKSHCKVVIISHLGRPEGRDNTLSLEPVAVHLGELLGQPVNFVDDCIGDKVFQAVKKSQKGSVTLLENLRFYNEEEANSEKFAKNIVKSVKADYFVQDGFGVVHRKHASTDAITQLIPSVAGLLLEREYINITSAVVNPKRPFVAVVGGAKISDKIPIIEHFVDTADKIIIGGAMANNFLRYKGHEMGASKLEPGQEKTLDKIYSKAHEKLTGSIEDFIILPTDVAVANEISDNAKRRTVKLGNLAPKDVALDIGEESITRMITELEGAKTIVWNGTLGYATLPEFAHSSARLALHLATNSNVKSIIGGGDTADFVLKWSGDDNGESFSWVSTGGGASLELLAGKKLPGIESLLDAPR